MKKEDIQKTITTLVVILFLLAVVFIQTKRIEDKDKQFDELKTSYLSQVNFNDILEMEKDSLIKNVKVREKVIYRTKIVVKKLESKADSSYIEFIKDTTLRNCTTALIDCRVLNDSLDSENNLLTQQNRDLTDLVQMDSLMIDRYVLSLSSAQKNIIQLKKEIAKHPNWWERNDMKIGICSGVAITAGTGYLLYRLIK